MLVEIETVERAQAGDSVAFNEIVRVYRKRILGTIYRLIGRSEDVEDVSQEVFVRLYYSLDQLRSVEVFEPWLYRLTTNAAYDYLRKRRRSNNVRMADMSEEQVVAADAAESGRRDDELKEQAETREFLDVLLGEVSEEDRILLTLKEVQGLSLKELSKIYEVNENALKVRLFRARKRALKAHEALKKRQPNR
jgi:RNA polymerase sigma-70 factor (ECF subfamily)